MSVVHSSSICVIVESKRNVHVSLTKRAKPFNLRSNQQKQFKERVTLVQQVHFIDSESKILYCKFWHVGDQNVFFSKGQSTIIQVLLENKKYQPN